MRRQKPKRKTMLQKIFSRKALLQKRPAKLKSYLVRIDRNSIVKNPDAGAKEAHELIQTLMEITIRTPHQNLEETDERIKLVSCSMSFIAGQKVHKEAHYLCGGMNTEEALALMTKLKQQHGTKVSIKIENVYRTIHLLEPIPPYSYKYLETEVQCRFCRAKLPHTMVKDDYGYDECDEIKRDICPQCKHEECCVIDYESFESYLLGEAGLPKLVIS